VKVAPDGRGRGVAADVRENPLVDRPVAGPTPACTRVAGSDTTNDGRKGVSRCSQSRGFQRRGAVKGLVRPSPSTRCTIFSCSGRPDGPILTSTTAGKPENAGLLEHKDRL